MLHHQLKYIKNQIYDAENYIELRVAKNKEEGIVLKIETLKQKFDLSKFEFFTLICSLSCEMDMGFQKIFSIFHNISSPK